MDRYIYTFPSSNGWVSDGLQFARGLLVKLCWQDWLEKNYIRLEHVNVQLNTKHKSVFSFKLERLAFANWWNRLHSLVCQNKGSVYSKNKRAVSLRIVRRHKRSRETRGWKGQKKKKNHVIDVFIRITYVLWIIFPESQRQLFGSFQVYFDEWTMWCYSIWYSL